MNKLTQLRDIIASLDETLVMALCGRAQFKTNAEFYHGLQRPSSAAETAKLFGTATTIAGRALAMRPLYVKSILPLLCEPGIDEDRRKCIAADANCMNALVQRLNLSVHVAALKMEEMPEALRQPLISRDAEQLERAITNQAVEAEVIARVLEMSNAQTRSGYECPAAIAKIYAEWVIPISRKIQIHDLLVKYR